MENAPSGRTDAVRQAQAGDHQAFAQLYREHAGRVYALCLRLAGDPARADELTQDVFVRAWDRLASFRGESAFSSWLYRLAVNVVFMDQRAGRRRRARVEGVADLELVNAGVQPETDTVLDLEQAIASLPEGARQAFVLHHVYGYQHEEISQMTGIAVGTSKAQVFRARRLLREALQR
ncbi:MAG TPA: sigma-70 family RNA polymerase sigma factor [Gemmatimonadales bacterium]|nr:sigma-70 family RNA polymerase sigma factor [Gemmatimonadales bacterium]